MERIILPAKLENLEKMFAFLREGASKQGFDAKMTSRIQLACEEALVNVINYAYPDKNGNLEITYDNRESGLQIEIIDNGIAFDPLSLPDPDITAPMEERRIGGLGIFMMKKIMDCVTYRRDAERNILTLVKLVPSEVREKLAGSGPQAEKAAQPPDPAKKEGKVTAESFLRWQSFSIMKREDYKKGDLIFKTGDKADRMFVIKKGAIRLVEINKVVREGDIIGEMGLFSPDNKRTASAVCEEQLEVYTISRADLIAMFSKNPNLAIEIMQLSFERFIENLKSQIAARERIESELRIAQQIQASMLPSVFPQRKEFDIFAMMDPAKEVGGDFYDFFFIDERRFCFVIGDVSGKGVPAALFMAITKTLIKNEAKRGLPTAEILSRVNNILCPDNQTCLFVTVFCVIIDVQSGLLQYTNAGHNPPLLLKADGTVDYLQVPCGFVMGVMENNVCENRELELKNGETLFLYTDGVTEAMNLRKEMFGEERLKDSLRESSRKPVKEMIGLLREQVQAFAHGAEQSDDITMLAVTYKGE